MLRDTSGAAGRTRQRCAKFLEKHASATDQGITNSLVRIFHPEFGFYRYKDRTTRYALQKIIEIVTDTTPRRGRKKGTQVFLGGLIQALGLKFI